MPIQYERDDGRQVVVVTLDGDQPTVEDMRRLFNRHRTEGVWQYGTLYDLRRMTGRPSFNYLRDLMANAASHVPSGRTRGPVAFVADAALHKVATAFAELEVSKHKIQVFRTVGEAHTWLAKERRPSG